MGNRFAGKISEQLKKLTDAKITVHCQAVIVPGLNDELSSSALSTLTVLSLPSEINLTVNDDLLS